MTREAGRHFFDGKDGVAGFAELFGDKDTLVIYSFMYGPQRKTGCPMCTSQLSAWDGIAPHVKQRAALVITARSPIKRILAYGKGRGWEYLRLYSDPGGNYTRDYVSAEDADMPGYNVFTRKDGTIRHFWRSEGGKETADAGQDSHDAPDMSALWVILDTTPEGRGTDWYPRSFNVDGATGRVAWPQRSTSGHVRVRALFQIRTQETAMSQTVKVKGPASYFPSIEKTYGKPISHWMAILKLSGELRHMQLVSLLKTAHQVGHGHANALVAHFLAQK